MSDDDFMQESDDEQYDFEYEEDDDDVDAGHVGIENKYYNAKQLKATDPEEALTEFLGISREEEEKGEWGLKGLKQAIKLEFKLKLYKEAVQHYAELLTYVPNVNKNYSEKSINNMLDFVEKSADRSNAGDYLEQFYSLTLDTLQAAKNERLWLKTNIKLTKLMLDRKDYGGATKKLRELHSRCQKDGADDPTKGTYLLEICALEIQMHADLRNNKQLKRLYQRALRIKSAVPHPRIMGIIRECGGKMHLSEENWAEAQTDFFESFRNYDEAGSLQRIQVLNYLILTTMLVKSEINPFDSQETKPYKTDPRVAAMTALVDAYQRGEVRLYEDILRRNQDILADPFIAENIDEVTRNMRTKGLLKLIAPYTRMRLDWVSKQLQLPAREARDIIGFLITDGRIDGGIDEREGSLVMSSTSDLACTDAIEQATNAVGRMFTTLMRDGPGFKSPDTSFAVDMGASVDPLALPGRGNRRKGKMPQSSMWM